ncbi:MAG: pilus assembly protein TadG-related protein [Acidimicrobiales bacterium]
MTEGRDRGSVLLLFPAALLVVLTLGAIAVDAGVVFLHQRELAAAAGAAANDAITLGLDPEALRSDGQLIIDPARAESAVVASLARRGVLPHLAHPPVVAVEADRVTVTLTMHADYVIARALPGVGPGRVVSASVTARAVGSPLALP